MGYIYRIKNKIDNKIYIGQTIQDLEDRWRGHLKKHSNCRYLKSAFKKYGMQYIDLPNTLQKKIRKQYPMRVSEANLNEN